MAPLRPFLRAAITASIAALPLQAQTPSASGGAQAGGDVGPRAVAVPDPEGEVLLREYGSVVKEWNEHRVFLSRGGRTPTPQEVGPHPSLAFRDRFAALLAKDSGIAQCWWLDNLQYLTPDTDLPARKRVFVELYDKLLARNASQPYMMNVLGAVRVHRATLGDEVVDSMLERLVQASTNPELQARAALMRAAFHAPADPAKEPARWEEVLELYRGVVASWPHTVAAVEAAGVLVPAVQTEYEAQERAWIERCLELHRRGADPKEWPAPPVHEVAVRMRALAAAGQPAAVRWMNRFYSPLAGQDHRCSADALAQFVSQLGSRYPVMDSKLGGIRLGLVELAVRQFPEDPATGRLLDALLLDLPAASPQETEARIAPLLASTDPHRRAIGMYLMVVAHGSTSRWPGYLAAYEWSERLARECPGDALVELARGSCVNVPNLLPGRPAPEIAAEDLEKKWCRLSDYHGRVVLLVFYSLFTDRGFDEAGAWQEFAARNAARPFSVLGVNPGTASADGLYRKYAKYGISWRTLLPFADSDDILRRYMVREFPTTIVIDAEGKLRGRDLPWSETTKLLETCIAEAEAAAGGKK
ncbi:MAG: TlpA disulfide reductase family protein [Planctomycetota bacterium]